jgi:hypothetical protein
MMTQMKSYLATLLVACSLSVASADVASGTLNFAFGPDEAPVWDLTGDLQIVQELEGEGFTELAYGVSVNQGPSGKLTGNGVTVVSIGGTEFVAGEYTVRGQVNGGPNGTRVTMRVRINGQGVVAGIPTSFSIIIVYTADIDAETGELIGRARGRARFSNVGSGKINTDFAVPLPASATGAWSISINVVPLRPISGTAYLTPSSGQTITMNVRGNYSESRDETKLKASGTQNRVTLLLDGAGNVLELSGRVWGQRVRQFFSGE